MSDSDQSNTQENGDLTFNIYGYDPSEAAAIVFLVVFILLSIAHSALVIRARLWWYIIVVIGGIAEIIGWAGRLWSAINVYNLNAFLTQQICLVLAPCFFSAVLYGSLGMLIRALGFQFSRLRPTLYLWVFCTADIVAIIVQAIGGAMAAIALEETKDSTLGTHIMVAGIVLQLLSMIMFSVLAIEFFIKARGSIKPSESRHINAFASGIAWGSFWILVRCVYRTAELSEGWTGYLITHQPYFLCLDSIPMVFTMAAFLPSHPYFCLPNISLHGLRIDQVQGLSEKHDQTSFRSSGTGVEV